MPQQRCWVKVLNLAETRLNSKARNKPKTLGPEKLKLTIQNQSKIQNAKTNIETFLHQNLPSSTTFLKLANILRNPGQPWFKIHNPNFNSACKNNQIAMEKHQNIN